MILPTKHLSPERSLLAIGAEVVSILNEPKTISRVWEELVKTRSGPKGRALVPYGWFVLSLDLLFILGAIECHAGHVARAKT